jgi:hypothetical protein
VQALMLVVGAGAAHAATTIDPTFFGQHLEDFPGGSRPCGASNSSCPAPPWGASAIRLWDAGVAWCDLEPNPNTYNWANLDAWLNTYPNADFVYTFGKPPGWALGLVGGCSTSSNSVVPDENAWKEFVTQLVQHANGRIKYFEIWNEWDGGWGGTTAQMVAFTHDAAQIIHGANQGLKVLTPSVSAYDGHFYGTCTGNCSPNGNLENFLKADPASTGDIDIVDVHTYPKDSTNGGSWPENYLPQWLQTVASYMREPQTGYASYPLWSTEGSWGKNSQTFPDYNNDSLGHGQRAFVARYYLQMLTLGVGRAYWYAYANPSWGTLWTSTGTTPGFTAMNELVKTTPTLGWLSGATLTAPCSEDASITVWTCDITRAGGYAGRILWAQSGPRTVPAPSGYTTLRRLDGTSCAIGSTGCPLSSTTLSVTTEPVLIEN